MFERLNNIPPIENLYERIAPKGDKDDSKKLSAKINHADNYNPEKQQPFASHFGANKLENHPAIRENLLDKNDIEQEKELNSIKNIFKSGDLDLVIDFLQEEKVARLTFHKETSRVKNEYEKELSSADFLTPKDWHILTAIELFDKRTFKHSVGTYLVVKNKIEERLKDLGTEIKKEGVTLEQLYRACLFHDIGKIAIPEFLINSKANDRDWVNCFILLTPDEQDDILVNNKILAPDSIRHDSDKMYDFLSKNRHRAVKFVPVKAILNKEQKELLDNKGFDSEKPLGEIMKIHEEKSEEILTQLGFTIEAFLAGNHHNYKHKDNKLEEKPASLSTMHIGIEIASNIIHFADIQNALNGDRSYHHKQPMLRIMAFLVDDAEKGITDPILTARWIKDELDKMSPAYLSEIRNMTAKHQHHNYLQERNEELLLIDDFLLGNLPENSN